MVISLIPWCSIEFENARLDYNAPFGPLQGSTIMGFVFSKTKRLSEAYKMILLTCSSLIYDKI